MPITHDFKHNRQRLFDQMLPNSVAVVPTAPVYRRSADEDHRFLADNDFYYLTGFKEPEAVAVLIKSDQAGERFVMFNRRKDPFMEQWVGRRAGQEGAVEVYGADEAHPVDELQKTLPSLLSGMENLYVTLGRYKDFDEEIKKALNTLRDKVRAGERIPDTLINVENLIFEMRLIKTPAEIECLRVASEATIAAHERAMRFTHPGANEYQVHAEIIHEFLKRGCMGEAYQSIIAGGENACILHYIENNHDLKDGDLLLIDAGAKYDFLCADVTRTFPVNGKFSGEQKAIYEIVLEAQLAVIDKLKPGLVRSEMAETAIRCITQGLVDLGLLKGNVDSLIEQKAYRPFYMHDIGHWLGRDVHDVGRYKVDGQWRNLEKDMVMTVEPGIYIKPGLEVDEKWWGIGVRIEDNLLITDSGSENFTKGLAKSIADVEALTAA